MGLSRLFRSRWAALLWSAGILWAAYDVASDAPADPGRPAPGGAVAAPDATGDMVDAHDLAIRANAGN